MEKLIGDRIYLRRLAVEDVSQEYVNWLNDETIYKFLESRWSSNDLASVREYVDQLSKSDDNYLLGIFIKEDDRHIGNIKVGEINRTHKFASLGIIIGDKSIWGKGYGCEAIKLAVKYAFEKLGLNKIIAGIYANNIGSYKSFVKAGFSEVGRLKNHRIYADTLVDEIIVEIGKKEQVLD